MALFEWNDEYSVKIPSIDAQHRKIVELINKLHEAMQARHGKEVLGSIFDELVKYTKTHFANEERRFAVHGYTQAAAHHKEHTALTTKALALQADFNGGKVFLSADVLEFLKDWLIHHIGGSDHAYAPFLISKGVK
jgi:hemerythrin